MKSLLLALAFVASSAGAAPINLVINGSFEDSPVAKGSWVNVPSINGWRWANGSGTGFELRNNAVGTAQDGSVFIELDSTGNSSISQAFGTLNAGATYDLSFWYSPRINQLASTNGIEVFWNEQQLGGTITADGLSANLWGQHAFKVRAAAGSNTLRFSSVGISDSLGGNLDNVRLSAAVPEPASLALVALALGTMALIARRRRI